jgi:hypothetical protein
MSRMIVWYRQDKVVFSKEKWKELITYFITYNIENKDFMWVGNYDKDILQWRIYSETDPKDQDWQDLEYQSPADTYSILDFIEDYPELENEDWKVTVENWINYLYDNDYIYAN